MALFQPKIWADAIAKEFARAIDDDLLDTLVVPLHEYEELYQVLYLAVGHENVRRLPTLSIVRQICKGYMAGGNGTGDAVADRIREFKVWRRTAAELGNKREAGNAVADERPQLGR